MKKSDEYKVIEENYYSENVNDKTVLTGTLDDCKDWRVISMMQTSY